MKKNEKKIRLTITLTYPITSGTTLDVSGVDVDLDTAKGLKRALKEEVKFARGYIETKLSDLTPEGEAKVTVSADVVGK